MLSEDILFNCSQATMERGRTYASSGLRVRRVRAHLETDSIRTYTAEVVGTKPYEVYVSLERGAQTAKWDFNSNCSCPVGFNCKHGVALALVVCDDAKRRRRNTVAGHRQVRQHEIDRWFENYERLLMQPGPLDDRRAQVVSYVLSPSKESAQARLVLSRHRMRKDGTLGAGRTVDWLRLSQRAGGLYGYDTPDFATPNDVEIFRLLDAMGAQSWSAEVLPRGGAGFAAMQQILATGRCYWRSVDSAVLSSGGARAARFEWQRTAHGDYRLLWTTNPSSHALLATDPPLYIDTESMTVGTTFGTGVTSRELSELLQLPAIPEETADAFSRRWVRSAPRSPVPPPKEIAIDELGPETARPILRLHGPDDPVFGDDRYLISAMMGYGDSTPVLMPVLMEDEPKIVGEDDALARITPNVQLADKLLGLMDRLGFRRDKELETDSLVFVAKQRHPQRALESWAALLNQIPGLEAKGWEFESGDEFDLRFLSDDSDWHAEVSDTDNRWFSLSLDVELDGHRVHLLPIVSGLLSEATSIEKLVDELSSGERAILVPLGDGKYFQIDGARLVPVVRVIGELNNSRALVDNHLRVPRVHAPRLLELDEESPSGLLWKDNANIRQLGERLRNFKSLPAVTQPVGFHGQLRDYQLHGLRWLQFLRDFGFGGVLADEMGLGKTVQMLAHLQIEKLAGRLDNPALVVAPTSLVSNWRREAERFVPGLRTFVWHGPGRHDEIAELEEAELIITTFSLLGRDAVELKGRDYHLLIVDEAQRVKNSRTKAARILREVNASHKVCLTGTPMENHLGELWSILDLLMPELLGDEKRFRKFFRNPIERDGDVQAMTALQARIRPFTLRREKAVVADQLPEKTEIVQSVELEGKQRELYESIRISMEKRVRDAISASGLGSSQITVLDALLKLRQVCCDPGLVKLPAARGVTQSAKMDLLRELLTNLLDGGKRVLLFSQFTTMLAIIQQMLDEEGIRYTILTGQTRDRDDAIERFKNGDVDVFLISLKAGGVGLNLAEADTVIHYDPWWNPAVEDQASDRAHRIGQDKEVFVYKLLVESSVEERIVDLQARKKDLANSVFGNLAQKRDETHRGFNEDDLQLLFQPLS